MGAEEFEPLLLSTEAAFATNASQSLLSKAVESNCPWLLFVIWSLERTDTVDRSDAPLFVAILLAHFMVSDDEANCLLLLLACNYGQTGQSLSICKAIGQSKTAKTLCLHFGKGS